MRKYLVTFAVMADDKAQAVQLAEAHLNIAGRVVDCDVESADKDGHNPTPSEGPPDFEGLIKAVVEDHEVLSLDSEEDRGTLIEALVGALS